MAGYTRCYWYRSNEYNLAAWVEDAFQARSLRDDLIENHGTGSSTIDFALEKE
jgi:hypothetical protein